MTVLAFCVGLPLSLMRNLHSLASFSACSLLFYAGFVFQVSLAEGNSNNQLLQYSILKLIKS